MLKHEVLYIHPYGHLNDLVVPTGALTCLNSITAPKLGRYAFEVTDAEIRSARIVAMDVHWALALTGFDRVVQHVKAVNPEARVIVGGVTAGHYATDLLEAYPVDFVVRGDSEISFARLVADVLEDRTPSGIPNVFQRGAGLPTFQRMTEAEFDATDCLTADWFPTYTRVSTWDAVAFPQGRTIPVTRGCAFACPECYGSYGATFGRGYLMRSPEGVVHLLRRAEEMRLRNVRLFVAKPAPKRLSALVKVLAAAGPFRFGSSVGFYLCTPPSTEDLALLDAAFDHEVAISMIPPDEHVPVLKPKQLEMEDNAWFRVARQVSASDHLLLDVWNTTRGQFERTRATFAAEAAGPKVKVSFGAVWSVTRPTDTGEQHSFETVRNAVQPLWTFYLARLLSPALATLLQPFAYLDELDLDPDQLVRPEGPLGPFFDIVIASWKAHRLPTIPGLAFSLVRLTPELRSPPRREAVGTRMHGQLVALDPHSFAFSDDPSCDLEVSLDPAGIRLTGAFPGGGGSSLHAFLPRLPGQASLDRDARKQFDAWPVLAAALPASPMTSIGEREGMHVNVLLRAQEAYVHIASAAGLAASRGRTDIRYFTQRDQATPAAPATL